MSILRVAERTRAGLISNWRLRRDIPLYIMLLPGVIGLLVFSYFPMYGVIIAFQNFDPLLGFAGSPWVGLENFRLLLGQPDMFQIVRNTLLISIGKIILGQSFSILFALLLSEVRWDVYRRSIQSLSYVLHFLSWVIFGGILLDILSLDGIVNRGIAAVGLPKIAFLGSAAVFPGTIIATDIWKEFGFGAILYLAALTGIDPTLIEAAAVDGAGRFQRIWYIKIPGIASMIVLLAALSLGSVLNAGFEQVLILYNPAVYTTGDIIDTWVYREGLVGLQFSLGTAVGLLKAGIGFVLIALSYWLADRFANYRIF